MEPYRSKRGPWLSAAIGRLDQYIAKEELFFDCVTQSNLIKLYHFVEELLADSYKNGAEAERRKQGRGEVTYRRNGDNTLSIQPGGQAPTEAEERA